MRKKTLLFILLFSAALTTRAADIITATVAVTNTAGTTNGQTITINGNVRTWTNSVASPSTQILTNSTAAGSATNLYFQLASYPITGLALSRTTSTNVTLQTAPGGTLTVTLSAGWGAVSYVTNSLTSARAVRVPMSVESAGPRAEIASQLVTDLNNNSTNAFNESAVTVQNLVGNTNAQTITGIKKFNNPGSLFNGSVSNAPMVWGTNFYIGVLYMLDSFLSGSYGTNYYTNAAVFTANNWTFRGYSASFPNIISSGFGIFNGSLYASNNFGILYGSETIGTRYLGGGNFWTFNLSGTAATNYIGGIVASNSVIANDLVAENSATISQATFSRTNSFPAGSDISFGRYANTSLANGNNAAVQIGTNVFVQVSGPSSSFTICGIDGQPNRDGKLVIILNYTGQNMTIAHDSGVDPVAGNRIYTNTGADIVTSGNGVVILIYSGAASRWIVISFEI